MEDVKLDSVALDALLRDRAQFQGWLARLDENASRVPEAVTAKVRTDYEGRLHGVLEALRAHAGTVEEALDRLRTRLSSLEFEDASAAERLAEAELRHLVGEHDDAAWEALRNDVDTARRTLHADMEQTRQEVARLADVQAIMLEAPQAAAPAPALEPESAAVPEAPAETAAPATPAAAAGLLFLAPEPEPAEAAPPIFVPSAPKAMDELDFLKSVTDEAVEQPAPIKVTTVAPEKGKAVRCRECGHDNRPSDWYCDRCGSEISDL